MSSSGRVRSVLPWHVVSRREVTRVRVAVRGGRADVPEGVEVVGADLAIEADAKRVRGSGRLPLCQPAVREVVRSASAAHGRGHRRVGGG
jgi:hypothetical protein